MNSFSIVNPGTTRRFCSRLLPLSLAVAATVSIPSAAIAHPLTFPVAQASSPDATEPAAPGSDRSDDPLEDIILLLARDEPPLGSRSRLCPISPGLMGETPIVWSDRPTFFWEGEAAQITLYDFNEQAELWSQPLSPGDRSATYAGTPLEPGKLYAWELSIVDPMGQLTAARQLIIFEVMSAARREPTEATLTELADTLIAQGATNQAIAIEQARYFAAQGYWSDTLQILSSIETPSPEVSETLEAIANHVCQNGS